MNTKISAEFDGRSRLLFEKICEYCGGEYWVPQHRVEKARYCSRNCSFLASQSRVKLRCSWCDDEFYRPKSKIKNSKSGLFFCGRKCKDLAQKIGGIDVIFPDHYGKGNGRYNYRIRALKEYGSKCAECGYDEYERMLDVHHKDSDRSNNTITNLDVLCVWCHALKTRFGK